MGVVEYVHTQGARGALAQVIQDAALARRRRRRRREPRAARVNVIRYLAQRHLHVAHRARANGVRRNRTRARLRRGCLGGGPHTFQLEVVIHVGDEHGFGAHGTGGVARSVGRPGRRGSAVCRRQRRRGSAVRRRGCALRSRVAAARPRLDAAAGRGAGVAGARTIAVAVQDRAIEVEVVVKALPVHRRAARRAVDKARRIVRKVYRSAAPRRALELGMALLGGFPPITGVARH